MNKLYNIRYIWAVLLSLFALQLTSCKDDHDAPVIDGVWSNSVTTAAEKISASYPKEVICLHGHGFSGLRKASVNGVDIDLNKTIMYDTDGYITLIVPDEAPTKQESGQSVIKVVTAYGETTYQPFFVKATMCQVPSVVNLRVPI